MSRRRAESAFVLLALASMLASAALVSAPAASAQPAPTASSPLSDAQFQKILALIGRSHGKPAPVHAKIAQALGLGEKAVTVGRFAIADRQAVRYQISVLGGDKGYLLARHAGNQTRTFLVDVNRALVSGATVEGDGYPSTIPAADAAALLQQDLAAWARIADSLPAK